MHIGNPALVFESHAVSQDWDRAMWKKWLRSSEKETHSLELNDILLSWQAF
jgi:hypothetical protein